MAKNRIVMGRAHWEFQNFNVYFRDNPEYEEIERGLETLQVK